MTIVTKKTKTGNRRKCCFIWTKLFVSALFPLIFGIFTITFTIQQGSIARANRDQDQAQTDELRRQTVYDNFIDEVSKLLHHHVNQSLVTYLQDDIRVKTLNSLSQVDSDRKCRIIQFLYENKLIRSDESRIGGIVSLDEGDLSGIRFVQSPKLRCRLDRVILSGVLASNVTFDQCQMHNAQFDGASMIGARFIKTILTSSTFIGTNLTGAVFLESNIRSVNFSSAVLTRAMFYGVRLERVDFTNADLLGSDLTMKQLTNCSDDKSNVLLNTRLPDGSFSVIDPLQLIENGAADMVVCERKHFVLTSMSAESQLYTAKPFCIGK